MSSQFVDMNADGFNDILVGSFSGSPYWIENSKDGFKEPAPMMDSSGETILISAFWNKEDNKWDKSDRAGSEGHCTSVAAVDWDNDGDHDLILGDYYGGKLFLRLNEGTAEKPAFATTNSPIEAGGEQIVIAKGLAAPRVVDWNEDGKFDILCGGAKGGVYLFANTGSKSEPKFAACETLIEPIKDDSFIKKVPAVNNHPTQPGSSFHLELVDYDGDGDQDLLVGARSSWDKSDLPDLSEEDQKRLDELTEEIAAAQVELRALAEGVETEEEVEAYLKNPDYIAAQNKFSKLLREKGDLNQEPTDSGDFVWLFRRK